MFLVGCGGAPPLVDTPEEAPAPRARLLDEELRAPEGAAGEGRFQLEMPALGSELPRVIVVPPADGEPPDPRP